VRAVLTGVALLAAAWLGGNALAREDAREGNDGLARAKARGWSPVELERAHSRYERARRFLPDTDLLVKEGSALVLLGAPQRAAPLLRRAVRAEPENATAWLFLYATLLRGDPAKRAVARRRALELDPAARRRLEPGPAAR